MLSVLPPLCCMFYSINNVNAHCEANKESASHVPLYTDEYFHHTRRPLILRAYLHRQQPRYVGHHPTGHLVRIAKRPDYSLY